MDEKGNTDYSEQIWAISGSPREPSPAVPYLIVIEGATPGAMLPLSTQGSSLGRSSDNTLQLVETSISRQHAAFQVDDRGVPYIVDLNSTNGTFLNGAPIPPHTPTPLADSDRLQFGSALIVKFNWLDPYEERFHREMFDRTVRDGLTGLFKRDHFVELMNQLIERNARRGIGTGAVMLDIDFFKSFNDEHGHDVGDAVLRVVAELLREETRGEELMARYGGEEFVMALPAAHLGQVEQFAEWFRSRLAGREIYLEGRSKPLSITASLGVAFAPADRPWPSSKLIHEADVCLLEAKARGRNRVISPRTMDARPDIDEALITQEVPLLGRGLPFGSRDASTTAQPILRNRLTPRPRPGAAANE